MDDSISSAIATYITNQILKQPARKLSPTEPLISRGLIDSFSLVDLALFIEDHFGVRLEDTELNASTFDTLEQLAALVRERQG